MHRYIQCHQCGNLALITYMGHDRPIRTTGSNTDVIHTCTHTCHMHARTHTHTHTHLPFFSLAAVYRPRTPIKGRAYLDFTCFVRSAVVAHTHRHTHTHTHTHTHHMPKRLRHLSTVPFNYNRRCRHSSCLIKDRPLHVYSYSAREYADTTI